MGPGAPFFLVLRMRPFGASLQVLGALYLSEAGLGVFNLKSGFLSYPANPDPELVPLDPRLAG